MIEHWLIVKPFLSFRNVPGETKGAIGKVTAHGSVTGKIGILGLSENQNIREFRFSGFLILRSSELSEFSTILSNPASGGRIEALPILTSHVTSLTSHPTCKAKVTSDVSKVSNSIGSGKIYYYEECELLLAKEKELAKTDLLFYNKMSMFKNLNHLKLELQHIFTYHDPHITVHKKDDLTKEDIDKLIYTAVFTNDATLKAKTQRIIKHLAKDSGIYSASIRPLYHAFGEQKVKGFTVPAMNIRTLTYDLVRTIFKVAKKTKASAFVIEIARTESEYTYQPPDEFVSVILAAALREEYIGPVFIQGDHCQFHEKKYKEDKEKELADIQSWVKRLIDAGFRNVDIDGSTLVDLSKKSLHDQQKENAFVTAEMTKFIRGYESQRVTESKSHRDITQALKTNSDPLTLWSSDSPVTIGGEIGHIGDKNSSVSDFEAFMSQYLYQIPKDGGISKVSVQTGTSHGGVINKNGSIQKMSVDFSTLQSIGRVAQTKYHLGGPVQHGASTLPIALLNKFVDAGTLEIHLSTGFQNIIFDTMPQSFREHIYQFAKKEYRKEWQEGWSEEQFFYKIRKKTLGPFKEELWQLPQSEKQPIINALEQYVETVFKKLKIENTKDIVEKYVKVENSS